MVAVGAARCRRGTGGGVRAVGRGGADSRRRRDVRPATRRAASVRATSVLLVDGAGQADLFDVTSVAGSAVRLAGPRTRSPVVPFPAGAWLVPVTVASYYLQAGDDGRRRAVDVGQRRNIRASVRRSRGQPRDPSCSATRSRRAWVRRGHRRPAPPTGRRRRRRAWTTRGTSGRRARTARSSWPDGAQQSRLPCSMAGPGLVPLPPGAAGRRAVVSRCGRRRIARRRPAPRSRGAGDHPARGLVAGGQGSRRAVVRSSGGRSRPVGAGCPTGR